MKRVFAILIGILICSCMTGCQKKEEDFISQIARQNKAGLQVTIPKRKEVIAYPEYIEIKNEGDASLFRQFENAVNQTGYYKYLHKFQGEENYSVEVNWEEYIKDILEEENIQSVDAYEYEEEFLDKAKEESHEWRKIKNCLIYMNANGQAELTRYFVFVTEDQELKAAFEKEKLGWVVDLIRGHEQDIKMNPDMLLDEVYYDTKYIDIVKGNLDIFNGKKLGVDSPIGYEFCDSVVKQAKWMTEYIAADAWGLCDSSHNEVCDYLRFTLSDVGVFVKSFELCVYGQDKKIKEIVYSKDKDQAKSVPDYLQGTMKSYLLAMGASEEETEDLLNHLREENGTVGKIGYLVETSAGGKVYKFYVREDL